MKTESKIIMKMGIVLSMLCSLALSARAEYFTWTNITDLVVTNKLCDLRNSWWQIDSNYYGARQKADDNLVPWYDREWIGTSHKTTIYYEELMGGNWWAGRWDVDYRMDVDLRDQTNFSAVVLDWNIVMARYDNAQGEDVETWDLNYAQELKTNQLHHVSTGFIALPWATKEQALNDEINYHLVGDTYNTPLPSVMARLQTREYKTDTTSPGQKDENGDSLAEEGDPINAINGSVTVKETDIVVPCPGISLSFRRFYNSVLDYDGPLGHRWTHSYDSFLFSTSTVFTTWETGTTYEVTNTWKVVQAGSGSRYWYRVATNGAIESSVDNNWRLEETAGAHTLTLPGGAVYAFDTNGVLTAISNEFGNVVTLSYTNEYPSNLLAKIEHSNGQALDIEYTGDRISKVKSPCADFYVTYAYNAQGELTNAVRTLSAETQATAYLYDYTTNYWNHSLTQRVNAAGHRINWTYATNDQGQVTSKGIHTVVANTYYDTEFCYTNKADYAAVTKHRGDLDYVYEYHYDPVTLRLTERSGPELVSTNPASMGRGVRYEFDDVGNTTNEVFFNNHVGQSFSSLR